MSKLRRFIFVLSLCFFCLAGHRVAFADGADKGLPATTQSDAEKEQLEKAEQEAEALKKQQSALKSLEETQQALKEKLAIQSDLQRAFKVADESEKADLQLALNTINAEVTNLKRSFEQVAIGGVNLEVFGEEEAFDWQKELILITQPVLESLKGLTEKPRKVERLKTIIEDRTRQVSEIEQAISTVESRLSAQPPASIADGLKETLSVWQGYQKNNRREIDLAEVQLESLLGNNESWSESLGKMLRSFFDGRGKTLFIALITSLLVWWAFKGLLWLLMYQRQGGSSAAKQSKSRQSHQLRHSTSYRVALYLYKLLTSVLIVIAIMIVFYVRGDLLLLALMIIVCFGLAIALKQLLPRYVTEAKTLLNLGAVREKERIIYNGIPWEVVHINVHTILKNPCLQGVLRVPLSELININSRPINKDEIWFPSEKSDYLLMADGTVAEVLSQTPEYVELKSRGGMRITHPTQNLFGMDFYNLTRGGSFGIASVFGIDYSHADISLTTVPEVLKAATVEGLRSAGLNEHVEDVLVDFQAANSSSLDYLIYVTMNSRVASSYFKVGRVIQQSCVRACHEKNWGVPFPQLTLHKAG